MKDWEITEAYFLPRILCWRTSTLPGNVPKPNLKFYSLSEDNQWTAWKSSDYFYPEMIPEPDYSDSTDDSGDEAAYSSDRRSAIERLRDLTEVYVSNVSAVTSQKKTPAGSAPKSTQKQKPRTTAKKETNTVDEQQPKPSAKTPTQKRSKSPTGKAAKPTATSTTKKSKSPQTTTKTAPKRKPSPKRKAESTATADTPKTATGDTKISKAKPESPKTVSKRKTSPKAKPKAKATDAESATKAAGDVKTKSTKSKSGDAASLSSPATSGQSQSSEVTSSDEEQKQLIQPRKPYVSSTEKQKLHKELKFSQKYGKLSSSKTELQLALQRYTENKVKRELDAEEKSSLEKILEYQARKIEMQETMDKSPAWLERLQRPPSTLSDPNKEEFYRVHAKVVSNSILAHCFLPDNESPTSECLSLKTSSDSSSDS